MFQQIRERMSMAKFAGPRLFGRLDAPARGVFSPDVGRRVFALARFRIKAGCADAFVRLADKCFHLVAANEPGTLGYEWFLNDARDECLTLDIYQDAAALSAHLRNAGSVMAQLFERVDSEIRVFGALPLDMQAKLSRAPGTRFVAPQLQGIL
jgi:quinol monooxygenase YgiN